MKKGVSENIWLFYNSVSLGLKENVTFVILGENLAEQFMENMLLVQIKPL